MSIRAQTQLMCSISTTEPSSEGNVSRLEVGQMEVSCPQGGSAAATFWHPRCFWITHPSLFHLDKTLLQSACLLRAPQTLSHPPVAPKGPPLPSHSPLSLQNILPWILLSGSRISDLRIVLEKLPSTCLACNMKRKASHPTPAHHRDISAVPVATFAAPLSRS